MLDQLDHEFRSEPSDLLTAAGALDIRPVSPRFENPVYVGAPEDIHDIDGLELHDAAHALSVSIDELWKRIKNGQLLARTVMGKVFVYTDIPAASELSDLPPAPGSTKAPATLETVSQPEIVGSQFALSTQAPGNQEWALLLDHLSLAKEENREILRLTQDSMSKLTQMTDSILGMKDSIIASKEEQLAILKERLSQKEVELGRALKEKENLETLTQALKL